MDNAEKKAREESKEIRDSKAAGKAYDKASSTPPAPAASRPKDGEDKGEMGKKWSDIFK